MGDQVLDCLSYSTAAASYQFVDYNEVRDRGHRGAVLDAPGGGVWVSVRQRLSLQL